ncbi:unnamed protein product [Ixodes hexagonus]
MTADAAMSADNQSAEETPATGLNFVGRLGSLPAVVTLWDVATRSYARVKGSYAVVGKTLELAERGAGLVVKSSRPVVEKFGPQLVYVDGLACRGLDKLEAAYPDVAKKQPREILQDACVYGRNKCIDAKDYGVAKVADVKAASATALHCAAHPLQTAAVCTAATLACAQNILEAADSRLDKHMSERGIKSPEGPSSRITDVVSLLTLLDTIALKTQVCVKADVTTRATALCQHVEGFIGRVRKFFTSPVESTDAVNFRHVYLSMRFTYMAVFVDRPFFLLRDLFIYIRLSDFLALTHDVLTLAHYIPHSKDEEFVQKRPIVDSKRRRSSSDTDFTPVSSDVSGHSSDV